jgi:probable rRNA maturation factor
MIMQKVHFLNNDRKVTLKSKKMLEVFVDKLFKTERQKLDSLTYIFCSDEYLLGINKQYLSHDYYTDVITFTLSVPGSPIVGEVYISIDRVKDNALSLKIPYSNELHRVLFHAALHLCGYDDKTKSESRLMRNREDEYLQKFKRFMNVPQKTVSR